MFSYRHGFHAGNHADVLKHSILQAVLDHLGQKDNAYWYIDTHAGAGLYDLTGQWAQKRGEFQEGIGRVWTAPNPPELIARYVSRIKDLNPDGELKLYPGSPWLALKSMREQDRLRLLEWLEAEAKVLTSNLSQEREVKPRAVKVQVCDGFASLKALLPPPTRRALTLIDPSYENKQDYRFVVQTIKESLERFATGCYMVWYPRVNRVQSTQMVRQLQRLPNASWLTVEMTVHQPPSDSHGLFGSGVWILNPPHTLHKQLKQTMPWLTKLLGQDSSANWSIKTSADTVSPLRARQMRSSAPK